MRPAGRAGMIDLYPALKRRATISRRPQRDALDYYILPRWSFPVSRT
ncbi:MAG: hypothetical protein JST85_00840 [Acidobacteria bacterium]|nr:hypothetical protein [Acidobacteriota bacterium]